MFTMKITAQALMFHKTPESSPVLKAISATSDNTNSPVAQWPLEASFGRNGRLNFN